MENIIVTRLLALIKVNPSVEKRKLADIYLNQYLPVSEREIEKSLEQLLREKSIFRFRDRRGISLWWETKTVEQVLETVAKNANYSTRQLFESYKQETLTINVPHAMRLDIVIFQKLLMQLKEGGYINLVHSPAPSHWVIGQIQLKEELQKGALLRCA